MSVKLPTPNLMDRVCDVCCTINLSQKTSLDINHLLLISSTPPVPCFDFNSVALWQLFWEKKHPSIVPVQNFKRAQCHRQGPTKRPAALGLFGAPCHQAKKKSVFYTCFPPKKNDMFALENIKIWVGKLLSYYPSEMVPFQGDMFI